MNNICVDYWEMWRNEVGRVSALREQNIFLEDFYETIKRMCKEKENLNKIEIQKLLEYVKTMIFYLDPRIKKTKQKLDILHEEMEIKLLGKEGKKAIEKEVAEKLKKIILENKGKDIQTILKQEMKGKKNDCKKNR